MKRFAFVLLAAVALAAQPAYKVVNKIKLGGANRWDLIYVDTANHRLYVSHGNQTEVIDTNSGKLAGTIMGTNNVHGIAVANDLGRGFTTDAADNDVTIFDLKTLKVITKAKAGTNPDAIVYESASHRVFSFNGRSNDVTVIDARTGAVVTASVPVGGKPELTEVDGKGHVWVNLEDKAEIVEIDAAKAVVARRYSLAPCEEPTGLARNPKNGMLVSVCANKLMVVSDPVKGKVVASVPIGAGTDGVVYDDGYLFSANGDDGTITMAGETSAGKYEALATIPTMPGARTIAVDPQAHKLYLPAAEAGPATESKGRGRRQMAPESFQILVVGR